VAAYLPDGAIFIHVAPSSNIRARNNESLLNVQMKMRLSGERCVRLCEMHTDAADALPRGAGRSIAVSRKRVFSFDSLSNIRPLFCRSKRSPAVRAGVLRFRQLY
jgi:hypothetical protein